MKRKLMAMLLIVCMMCGSSLTTFAATGEASGNGTVSGNGNVAYQDTTVYSVTLPTDSVVNLVVDPQGLSQLASGNSASKDQLAAGAGTITSAQPVYVANKSSVDMKVSVKMKVTGDATAVVSENGVEADASANNILLYAVPSAVDTQGSTSENYVASTTGLVLKAEEQTADFLLEAADYVFKNTDGTITYVEKDGGAKHGFAIKFEGKVNTKADWSAYAGDDATKEIGYNAVFTFKPAETTDEAISDNGVYGLMEGYNTTVTVAAKNVEPRFTAGAAVGVINYTAGSGTKALEEIESVICVNVDPYDGYHAFGEVWVDADDTGSVITLKPEFMNFFKGRGTVEATVNYTLADGSEGSQTIDVVCPAN